MSKRNYIFKALLLVAVPFAGLAFSACSDEWDDHYNPDESQISGESLWQAIEGNPELSNFANVVKATGYDRSSSTPIRKRRALVRATMTIPRSRNSFRTISRSTTIRCLRRARTL